MKQFVFYAHAGAGNHGCEAIVRSSEGILAEPIKLYSMNKEQDRRYGLGKIVEIVDDFDFQSKRFSPEWFIARVQTKLTGSIEKEIFYRKKKMLSQAKQGDIWFSIGGDNYCYPGTEILAAENEILSKRGAKTVLWGCSVEPSLMETSQIAKDLARYDLITARETISYNALCKVNPNTVLVSDPAFTLKRVDLALPKGWQENNMIGINASPLILQSAKNGELAFDAYCRLIETIIEHTDCGIVLIPHVVWESNDDRKPLKKLYKRYKDSGRILLLDDCNCMELKGYIARCRMFIGARTHATIAAYSSCVPTLVLGYSVKSKGIAQDLFGTYKQYVLPVQELQNENELAEGFQWLALNENKIRNRLESVMPRYIKKAYEGMKAVEKL